MVALAQLVPLMTAGDIVRRYGPVLTAAFALGAGIAVSLVRAIDAATRTIGQN